MLKWPKWVFNVEVGGSTENVGDMLGFHSPGFYLEANMDRREVQLIKKIIFGGLPALFVDQNFAKITYLPEFSYIKQISKIC